MGRCKNLGSLKLLWGIYPPEGPVFLEYRELLFLVLDFLRCPVHQHLRDPTISNGNIHPAFCNNSVFTDSGNCITPNPGPQNRPPAVIPSSSHFLTTSTQLVTKSTCFWFYCLSFLKATTILKPRLHLPDVGCSIQKFFGKHFNESFSLRG